MQFAIRTLLYLNLYINSCSVLCVSEESRAEIRAEEVVAALINLLKPEEGVMTHEHATKCLLTIAGLWMKFRFS